MLMRDSWYVVFRVQSLPFGPDLTERERWGDWLLGEATNRPES